MPRDFQLLLRALSRHKMICALIMLQIAIASAVLGNGLNLVSQRYTLQRLSTGLVEHRLLVLDVEALRGGLEDSQRTEVLAAVDALAGVNSTAYINTLPFSGRTSGFRILHHLDVERSVNADLYYGSPGYMNTLGIQILAGRDFAPEDYQRSNVNPLANVTVLILSETLSRRLSATVGSRVVIAGRTLTVVGVAQDVMKAGLASTDEAFNSAFLPASPAGSTSSKIVINAEQGALSALVSESVAAATLATPDTLVWSARRFSDIRDGYFILDKAVIRVILALGILLGLVVAGGIGGLSSYWIVRRYKQIAIRRALGARRRDIAWYFHAENLVLTTAGAALGFIVAIAVSMMLTDFMSLPSMPIAPLSWGVVAMIVIGQLAILVPVQRAVTVPPAALQTA